MDWQESLKVQIDSLQYNLDNPELKTGIQNFLDISRLVTGYHFFTGVGKNMFVAAKVAATYDSLGIKSLYIDPVNTLHGSMGVFTSNDILIAISKSGETEELNRLIRVLKTRNFDRIVAVTANKSSTLSSLCGLTLEIPVKKEGDHLDMAPIASTTIFASVLDAIAVQISSERGYTKYDFVQNHPGGSLGKTDLE